MLPGFVGVISCVSNLIFGFFKVLGRRNFLKLLRGEKLFRGAGNYRMRALWKLQLLGEFQRQGLFQREKMF